MADSFVYDLPCLLRLHDLEVGLVRETAPLLRILLPPVPSAPTLAVLAGSFNPLTRAHVALVRAAQRDGADAVLLLLPLQAIDKERVTRASAIDRALVLQRWAERHENVGVALVNRGLYVEQAGLLAAQYPASRVVFVVGHDKIVQIFDPRYYTERDEALRALFARATFRVAPRLGQGEATLRALLEHEENLPFAPYVTPLAVDADVDALSSTIVRERVRAGEPWEALVPEETASFLREAVPYAIPLRLPGGVEIDRYGLRQALIAALATGRLSAPADGFAGLYRTACSDTPEGEQVRARLANH